MNHFRNILLYSFICSIGLTNCFGQKPGDAYQGGIIFYIFKKGDMGYVAGEVHGLIAATKDQTTMEEWEKMKEGALWGCYETERLKVDGTAIGMGLATSVNRLKDSRAKSKVIILLTDGVNNSGFVDPKIASELAIEYEIKTYTIGLGSNGTARAPVGILPNGKFQYGMTKVEIDEELLKTIAEKTGGLYFRATDNKKLEEIYEEINKLEKTEIQEIKYYNYDEKFRPLILLSLALLFIEWLMRNSLFRSFI